MRYQNWDVLVFPDDSRIPQQEFKTCCQVIHDFEGVNYANVLQPLHPIVTSFIPGLPEGTPFRMSIHCWKDPEISKHIQSITKTAHHVAFEARLFVDGNLAGAQYFTQTGPWPSVIDTTLTHNKHGEFEKLKFPAFHQELLLQSHWSPADDLGRIKVVIAEGIHRNTIAPPFERIKNIVSFSFQHAPLEVLEASVIAWPNATMWRQLAFNSPYIQPDRIERGQEENENRVPSPHARVGSAPLIGGSFVGSMAPPGLTGYPRQPSYDPFVEPAKRMFPGHQRSLTESTMPDTSCSTSSIASSRNLTEPLSMPKPFTNHHYETMQCAGAFESVCAALLPGAAQEPGDNSTAGSVAEAPTRRVRGRKPLSRSKAFMGRTNGAKALQPQASTKMLDFGPSAISPEVRSKKETAHDAPLVDENDPSSMPHDTRKFAQPFTRTNSSGSKRQRNATPVIDQIPDEDDLLRSSPSARKVSRVAAKAGEKDGGRRVLSGIENI